MQILPHWEEKRAFLRAALIQHPPYPSNLTDCFGSHESSLQLEVGREITLESVFLTEYKQCKGEYLGRKNNAGSLLILF